MRDKSDLYYECHVTIKPPAQLVQLETIARVAKEHDFVVPQFALLPGQGETEPKAFISARDTSYASLVARMCCVILGLQMTGFEVLRYKIEDTIIDSKKGSDILVLLR